MKKEISFDLEKRGQKREAALWAIRNYPQKQFTLNQIYLFLVEKKILLGSNDIQNAIRKLIEEKEVQIVGKKKPTTRDGFSSRVKINLYERK